MQLGWGLLVLLCAAGMLAWFWQDSLAAREIANRTAVEACERLSLQFLDGTVAFSRLAPMRGADGWLTFRRTYVFDYTANSIERRQGFVIVAGRRVESVGYAQDEATRPAAERPRPNMPAAAADIVVLEDWRKRSVSEQLEQQDPARPGDTRQ
jgi:hypothetical protein